MRVAGEEHPVYRPSGPLKAGPGFAAGDDDHIAGGDTDNQFPGHGPLQVVPELVNEQHAGLQTIEGEHQHRRLPLEAHPVERPSQVLHRDPTQHPAGEAHPVQVRPGHQPFPVRWTEGVGDGEVAGELVEQALVVSPVLDGRHQQRQNCGARHLHGEKSSIDGQKGIAPVQRLLPLRR
ncbi:MAG TPA: hypothetical protein VFX61_07040 [Micromonosporaceae bacterium]|nr:hypothetical protein [Micromonosporaceae bacterium]